MRQRSSAERVLVGIGSAVASVDGKVAVEAELTIYESGKVIV